MSQTADKKDVILEIKSLIEADGDTDRLEITTKGKMLFKSGNYYLTYRETDKTGFDGCSVLIKVEGEKTVTVSRSGDISSQLTIETGKRNLCSYKTPQGTAMLGISGNAVRIKKDGENPLEFYICYELDTNSKLLSKNQMFITVKECAN